MLVDEILKSVVGDDGYPGDSVASDNWPGLAPGTRGILNALSPAYGNWAAIVGLDPKPPVLWTRGSDDIVVADGSAWEMGTLGAAELVPGWPGADVYRRSRWSARPATSSTPTPPRAATSRPRCSKAQATVPTSTPPPAGATASARSSTPGRDLGRGGLSA